MGLSAADTFLPLNIAILTVSDTRTLENDTSGKVLFDLATADGHHVVDRAIIPDDRSRIAHTLKGWIADRNIDVVIATGGTGVTGRDVTPEAFEDVYEKFIPGFGELFRYLSYAKIGASTIQSRATAGVANGTYLFALPGSTSACRDAWEMILRTQLDSRTKPCNFAALISRLQER